ncbi:hypothetical protein LV779_16635 [Streptomyces thinghirensis]|nr:hypothetical protein [Streptomyces thinghirensis]
MLSWQLTERTVSVWTTGGRMKNVVFTASPEQLATLALHRKGESDLVHRDGKWFLNATCEVPRSAAEHGPGRLPRYRPRCREHRHHQRRRDYGRTCTQPDPGP